MNYDHGTSYGYDQIQTSPLMDNYDAPYMQVPRILRDRQYTSAALRSRDMKPVGNNATYYRPGAPVKHVTLDSQTIGRNDIVEPFCGIHKMIASMRKPPSGGVDINTNGMMTVFIFVLILIVVINSIHLKHLTKQVDRLACKNRAISSQLEHRH